MLIQFKIKNFKSFYHDTVINMVADTKKQELKNNLISIPLTKKGKKILPAIVIYGSNASGKTSIIEAFNTFKRIIINGTISKSINNGAINRLEICPFIHDIQKIGEPIEFEITFQSKLNIYNYLLSFQVNSPFNKNERMIKKEVLNIIHYQEFGNSIKEEKLNLFERIENQIHLNNSKEVLDIYNKTEKYGEELKTKEKDFSENLDQEGLFLNNAYKSTISLKIVNDILDWFQNDLFVVTNFNKKISNINFNIEDEEENSLYGNKVIDRLLKLADFGPQKILFAKHKDQVENRDKYILTSAYKPKGYHEGGLLIPAEFIESRGTTKLLDFWMALMNFLPKGGTMVIDELDASLHPELIYGIIELFQNPEVNKKGAQLIFNTHNPIYLQKTLFRRDQILFVEKDEKTYMSTIYRLSDFDVYTTNNYLKKYFEGDFGALPYIDFRSAMEVNEKNNG